MFEAFEVDHDDPEAEATTVFPEPLDEWLQADGWTMVTRKKP